MSDHCCLFVINVALMLFVCLSLKKESLMFADLFDDTDVSCVMLLKMNR